MPSIGIFAWFGYELPLSEAFERIRAAGFDTVSLWWGEYEGDLPLREQPEAARRLGLHVENAHAPFDGCNALWLPGEEGDRYAKGLCAALEGCAAAGVPVLVAHLSDGPAPPPCAALGLDRLRRVEEAAQRTGVTLALENLRHTPHLRAAMEALTGDKIGFCYDSGHHHGWCKEEPFLEKYGSRLAALHLHDNDGRADWHALPFDGTIDWRPLIASLRDTGYTGALSLEVQAFERYEPVMDAQAFLDRAYAAMTRLDHWRREDVDAAAL